MKKIFIFVLSLIIIVMPMFSVNAVSIVGACGSADGVVSKIKPTTGLCAPGGGTASYVSEVAGTWSWRCTGSNGGAFASCSSPMNSEDASSGGGGLVPDCTNGICGFNDLMKLVDNVIKFLLFTIATPLAALVFVYAGVKLLTSGGNTEAKSKAKKAITNLLIGYCIALGAWLIINTILTTLIGPDYQDNKDKGIWFMKK